MKIIITGSTGMIRMALIEKCIQEQIQVLVVCHKGSAGIRNIPRNEFVKVVEADLSEIGQLSEHIMTNMIYFIILHGMVRQEKPEMTCISKIKTLSIY